MQNNLFEIFNTIFLESPKPPKSIFFEFNIFDPINSSEEISSTKLSDLFEIFLHMLIYGFKKLELTFTKENINLLNQYFNSIGINIIINFEMFDTILFKDYRYINRYCIIDESTFKYDTEPLFIMNAKNNLDTNYTKLNELRAIYQIDYEYLIFINFYLI